MEDDNMDLDKPNSSTIAGHVHTCLSKFQHTEATFAEANSTIQQMLPHGSISDQSGRFRLWSSDIGAHKHGRSSLDYRLCDASHVREQVVNLLQELTTVLDESLDIMSGSRQPWEDLSDSESDDSEHETQRDNLQYPTELGQLFSNIAEINTCLMRLSMAIGNLAPHDQIEGSKSIEVSHYESHDIDHVRGKFPKAEEYLLDRLGHGISRRRQYLQYREEHHSKLEHGITQTPQDVNTQPIATNAAPSELIEATVASSIPLVYKVLESIPTEINTTISEETLSETSYASSVQDASKLRPPPVPLAGRDGHPFECLLCFRTTSARETAIWHKHVYRDLRAYVSLYRAIE